MDTAIYRLANPHREHSKELYTVAQIHDMLRQGYLDHGHYVLLNGGYVPLAEFLDGCTDKPSATIGFLKKTGATALTWAQQNQDVLANLVRAAVEGGIKSIQEYSAKPAKRRRKQPKRKSKA